MSATDYCTSGKHKSCPRKYQRFIVDSKSNKVVWLDEYRICECKKRGCKCYVSPKERTKVRKRKKK